MSEIEHTTRVIEALDKFKELQNSLNQLRKDIENERPEIFIPDDPVYYMHGLPPRDNYEKLFLAINDLWYKQDESGVTTRKYRGIVVCSSSIIEQVNNVNSSKDSFACAVRAVSEESYYELKIFKESIIEHFSMRDQLTKMGMTRINLNHCYRHIHAFNLPPEKIHYSISKNERSIKSISISEAEAELLSFNKGEQPDHIKIQLKALRGLKKGTPLAIVRDIAPHSKVNLFFDSLDVKSPVTRKPGLPVFVLKGESLPSFRFNKKNKRKNESKTRSDKIIEEQVFLPSLSVYKYKK